METPNVLIVGCEGGEDRLEIRSVELLSHAINSNPIQMIETHSVVEMVQGGHRLPFK